MKKEQIEVLRWWYGTRDFVTGGMLYAKYGKNRTLKLQFSNPAKERFISGKLHYQVCKAVGLNYKSMPALTEELLKELEQSETAIDASVVSDVQAAPKGVNNNSKSLIDDHFPNQGKHIPIISDVKLMQYPKVIRRLKMEYQENYQQRSIAHRKMREVPETNTTENMSARAEFLKTIKEHSRRMDYLYAFIEKYEQNSVVPLEEEVWPPENEISLPEDIEELKRVKKNLQTNNTKDNNLLLFQQKTKGPKENPMPDGPKRKRIEIRIADKLNTIKLIDTKILELENSIRNAN